MEYQEHLAFYLNGKVSTAPEALGLRPALLARYRCLEALRYDYPLVLLEDGPRARPLSGLVDEALAELPRDAEGDRLRHLARRIERGVEVFHVQDPDGLEAACAALRSDGGE
jgi:hypothetical protein